MRRIPLLLALALLLSSCMSEIDQSTRPENVAGSYQLVSFGGTTLPARVRADSVTIDVISGRLELNRDATWSETLETTSTFRGQTQTLPSSTSGRWSLLRDFAYISFKDIINGYTFSGTASGGTVIMETVAGKRLVYRR